MWCSITEMRWRCSVACIKCCKCIQIVLRIAMTVIGIRVSRRRSSSNTSTAVFTEEESSSRLSERTQEFSRWYAAVSREVESNKTLTSIVDDSCMNRCWHKNRKFLSTVQRTLFDKFSNLPFLFSVKNTGCVIEPQFLANIGTFCVNTAVYTWVVYDRRQWTELIWFHLKWNFHHHCG